MRLLLLSVLAIPVFAASRPMPPLAMDGLVEERLMIPMRDGVRVSGWVIRPAGPGKWPALFEQRHADITSTGLRKAAAEVAKAGYAVATINFRGTHESEGHFIGFRSLGWGEVQDGYDICEWLAAQAWCTAMVGSFGGSQGGYAQNYLAVAQPPHLVCQYVVDTGLSFFHDGYRVGGVTRPAKYQAQGEADGAPEDNARLMAERDSHPDYDDYWRAEDCTLHFPEMNVPCFTIGSWFDFLAMGSVQNFVGRQHQGGPRSRDRQQLLLGPWLHGRLNKAIKVGDLVFPETAAWPEQQHLIRWFDYWLKGADNGIMDDPPVRYYVMGAVGESGAPGNVWREARDWPVPARETRLYFHEAGRLAATSAPQKEARTTFHSDPLKPMSIPARRFLGGQDARAFEAQKEVRAWTTDTLTEPVEWTGEVKADIWLSSTAPDTDLILRMSDVYPDGRSILLMEFPTRARYREGFERQVPLKPGEPALLKPHIGWTSLIFNRGHRIRISISSTGAPLFEPNNQTGGAQTADWLKETRAADNTIWHDATHRSCLIVPVITVPAARSAE